MSKPAVDSNTTVNGVRIPGTRREEIAWAMYDWGSSAWSTIQITIVVYYITTVVFPREGTIFTGANIYAYGIGISMFLAALASPVIGAMADARANKRSWLVFATVMGAGCGTLMGIVPPTETWLIAVLFFLTCLGFELSWGIYNGFLPEIADQQSINRVSAWGFGLGYVGGGLALALAIVVLQYGQVMGLPDPSIDVVPHLRVGIVIMGLWWAIFSIPTLVILRDKATPKIQPLSLIPQTQAAFAQVFQTLRSVRRYAPLALFLIGFLFYNDGMQTVITQASVFAERELKMAAGELSMMILMVQFISLPGSLMMGWLSDRIGTKLTLHINLAVWVGLLVAAFFVTTKPQFWVMAGVLALVMGGAQSVSRALMAMMTPPSRSAEFMGFFNLSGRAVSMMGPILFATILHVTNSAHYAVLSLLVFFIIGWFFVLLVNVQRGHQQAELEG
ncbi:MAG: MFS transporter [Pirellulaceae bacterium]|nr:MFS transporter [Pirellulaceae bacterium]